MSFCAHKYLASHSSSLCRSLSPTMQRPSTPTSGRRLAQRSFTAADDADAETQSRQAVFSHRRNSGFCNDVGISILR